MKAIKNVKIYDFNEYHEDMYVVFDREIIKVGKMNEYTNNNYVEIDASNKLLMPGLINGHSHIYSTFARGLNVPFNPKSFVELLEQLWWKLDRNLTNEMTYYSGIVSGVEYLKNGVTTIIDHHASGEILGSLDALKESVSNEVGLRGIFCFETSDRFDVDECIKENIQFSSTNRTSKISGLFGMHAAFTLSNESLSKISKILDSPVHIHVAESIEDQQISFEKYNQNIVTRLYDYDLIKEDSIITHAIYVNPEEVEIIKKQKAVVALNVTSNMNNAVGLPNYQLFKEYGVQVIIGNDGIGHSMTSEYKNLYYSMHHMMQSPTLFSFEDLVSIINSTYNYASRILNTKLGQIKTGYQADLLLLDYSNPTPINENNIFGHLFFGLFDNFRPTDVFIEGNQVLHNSEVNNDLKNKFNKAKDIAEKLWNKIEKEG